jgi:dTDP-4-amino-4,6-dideoxygalactose transaminase
MADLIPRFDVSYDLGALVDGCLIALAGGMPSTHGLEAVFGNRDLVWTGSGRQALYLMLRALELRPGAKVAIPLFSSSSVASAVIAAGCEPFFIDVDPRTLTMDPSEVDRVRSRVAAIVPVHLFGNVADMDGILDAAAGTPVIEDTAQATLSLLRGRLAGTFGAGSFYSFASSKCIPAGGGGLAALNDAGFAVRVRAMVGELVRPDRLESLRCAAMQLAKAALYSRVLYGPFGNRARMTTEDRGYLLAKVDTRGIASSSALAVQRLAARAGERMQMQRENSLKLIDWLRDAEDVVLPVERLGARYGYSLFPVLTASEDERDTVMRVMFELGVDTSKIHYNSAECAARHGYASGCPVSENVARRILTLPNFAGLDNFDLERVALAFLAGLKRHRSTARTSVGMEACAV